MKPSSLHKANPRPNGFTLIELVISIVILSVIIIAFSNFLSKSIMGFTKSKDNITALSKLRYIDRRLAKELRLVNNDGAGSYVLTTLLTDNQNFGFTDTSGTNDVTIAYNGTDTLNISYTNPAASGDLGREVTAFSFNYYTSDGQTAATDGTDLVFVEYNVTVTENGASYSTRSRIMMRDKK